MMVNGGKKNDDAACLKEGRVMINMVMRVKGNKWGEEGMGMVIWHEHHM